MVFEGLYLFNHSSLPASVAEPPLFLSHLNVNSHFKNCHFLLVTSLFGGVLLLNRSTDMQKCELRGERGNAFYCVLLFMFLLLWELCLSLLGCCFPPGTLSTSFVVVGLEAEVSEMLNHFFLQMTKKEVQN